HGGQGEGNQARDRGLPPACPAVVCLVAGVEGVGFGRAQRGGAGGGGTDPGGGGGGGPGAGGGGGGGGGGVGGVPRRGGWGGGGVRRGADDRVGVVAGEPGVTQQRPGGQQHLVAELDGARGQGEQPFGGEGLQHRLDIAGPGGGFADGQVGPGGAVGGVDAVAAGGGQPGEHLPGGGLLGGGERLVGTLSAGGDGAFDAAGALVVGEGDRFPGPVPPGLVQGVGQQRQRAGPGGPGLAVADLGQKDGNQVVVDRRACFLGRFGDRQAQLPLGHRRHQVPIL